MPQTKSEEQLYATLQRGIQAGAASSFNAPLLEARRQRLIREAVDRFRSLVPERKLTERDAYLFVAALVATFDLEDDLQREISDGQRAAKHFER